MRPSRASVRPVLSSKWSCQAVFDFKNFVFLVLKIRRSQMLQFLAAKEVFLFRDFLIQWHYNGKKLHEVLSENFSTRNFHRGPEKASSFLKIKGSF